MTCASEVKNINLKSGFLFDTMDVSFRKDIFSYLTRTMIKRISAPKCTQRALRVSYKRDFTGLVYPKSELRRSQEHLVARKRIRESTSYSF